MWKGKNGETLVLGFDERSVEVILHLTRIIQIIVTGILSVFIRNMAIFKSLQMAYKSALTNHPLKVQSIQAGALMCFGDYISQTIIEEKSCDIDRTLRFGSVGLVIAPILHKWYGFLERRIPGKGFQSLISKVAIDQCCYAPCFLAFIVSFQNLIQGHSIEETKNKLKNNYFDILKSNYMLWPGVQIINFSIVPLAYRVVVIQSVAVSWNVYLSWKLNAAKHNQALSSQSVETNDLQYD